MELKDNSASRTERGGDWYHVSHHGMRADLMVTFLWNLWENSSKKKSVSSIGRNGASLTNRECSPREEWDRKAAYGHIWQISRYKDATEGCRLELGKSLDLEIFNPNLHDSLIGCTRSWMMLVLYSQTLSRLSHCPCSACPVTEDWYEQLHPLILTLKECMGEVVNRAKQSLTFVLLQELAYSLPQCLMLTLRRDIVFSQAVGAPCCAYRTVLNW